MERPVGQVQGALDKYGGEYIARLGGGAFDAFGKRAHKIITKGGNRTVIKADRGRDQTKASSIQSRSTNQWIAKTEDGAKKYTTLKKVLADIRAGK